MYGKKKEEKKREMISEYAIRSIFAWKIFFLYAFLESYDFPCIQVRIRV